MIFLIKSMKKTNKTAVIHNPFKLPDRLQKRGNLLSNVAAFITFLILLNF